MSRSFAHRVYDRRKEQRIDYREDTTHAEEVAEKDRRIVRYRLCAERGEDIDYLQPEDRAGDGAEQ